MVWVGACTPDPFTTRPGRAANPQRTESAPSSTDDGVDSVAELAADGGVDGLPLLRDGDPCAGDDECRSGHCDAICCGVGAQCCVVDADCREVGGVGWSCDDPANCHGSSGKLTCRNNRCSAIDGQRDDRACTTRVVANSCGLFKSVYCLGGTLQAGAPECPTACASDADCDDEAHCVAGVCLARLADGERCLSDQDCAGAFCKNIQNGFGVCCGAQGDCCKTAADCPASYGDQGVCRDQLRCMGVRNVAQCVKDQCASSMVDDEAPCNGMAGPACGLFRDVTCMANRDNTCRTTCIGDRDCADDAFCDENRTCVAKLGNAESCVQNAECASGNCQHGMCCAEGSECCKAATDCTLGLTPVCHLECQGVVPSPVCLPDASCNYDKMIGDDSVCTVGILDDCASYPEIHCTGAKEQPGCLHSCATVADCEQNPEIDCVNSQCVRLTARTTPPAPPRP